VAARFFAGDLAGSGKRAVTGGPDRIAGGAGVGGRDRLLGPAGFNPSAERLLDCLAPLITAPEGALKTPFGVNSPASAEPELLVATHLAAKSSAVFLASCAEAGVETIAKRKSANNLEFIVASSIGSILTMQRFSKPKLYCPACSSQRAARLAGRCRPNQNSRFRNLL
jgi:hypothetical protein